MANYTRFMMQGLFTNLINNNNDAIVSKQALFPLLFFVNCELI